MSDDGNVALQLTNMTLRIGLIERHGWNTGFKYFCVRASLGALLSMLEQRDAATQALWLPL